MKLLAPDPRRIGRPESEPYADRVPDDLAGGTPEPLRSELVAALGADRVATRAIDLVRYASDASPYRLIPRAVVVPRDAADVAKLFAHARRSGTPVVLRGGGTSLNGQAQTDGVLADVRRHFRAVEVLDDGARVRTGPGTVLGHVNRVLAEHGTRLGPDPASTDIATVGGVVANNSGGMRCGTTEDSYSTLHSLTLVLPSGTTIDTAAPGAEEQFARAEPELAAGLTEIGSSPVNLRTSDCPRLDRLHPHPARVPEHHQPLEPAIRTRDHQLTDKNPTLRKRMFAVIGRFRPPSTALITHNLCVRPEQI